MDHLPTVHVESPIRPESDSPNTALLFASRFRSLLIQYGVGIYFRSFHRKYTRPEDFPKMHVITYKGETANGPAGIIYRRLQVEVELANATIKLYDYEKKVLINFCLDTERAPHVISSAHELEELNSTYGDFEWPSECPRFPDHVLCVYLDNREQPLIFWNINNDPSVLKFFTVIVFLIYATRRRLEQEILIQDEFSLAIEEALRETAMKD